jgi:hypothetical protein
MNNVHSLIFCDVFRPSNTPERQNKKLIFLCVTKRFKSSLTLQKAKNKLCINTETKLNDKEVILYVTRKIKSVDTAL